MRKEYIPAIILYAISALLFVASAVCVYFENIHWATVGLFAVSLLLFASSRLVKIGNNLRKEGEKKEKEEETEGGK